MLYAGTMLCCAEFTEKRDQPFQERHLPGSHHPWVRIVSAHRVRASRRRVNVCLP